MIVPLTMTSFGIRPTEVVVFGGSNSGVAMQEAAGALATQRSRWGFNNTVRP